MKQKLLNKKNMSIESQANEVRKVKRSESGMILDPITLSEDASLSDALHLMSENKIGGIPVINKEKKLAGIITNRDLRFEKKLDRKVSDVMTSKNLITANEGVLRSCVHNLHPQEERPRGLGPGSGPQRVSGERKDEDTFLERVGRCL